MWFVLGGDGGLDGRGLVLRCALASLPEGLLEGLGALADGGDHAQEEVGTAGLGALE